MEKALQVTLLYDMDAKQKYESFTRRQLWEDGGRKSPKWQTSFWERTFDLVLAIGSGSSIAVHVLLLRGFDAFRRLLLWIRLVLPVVFVVALTENVPTEAILAFLLTGLWLLWVLAFSVLGRSVGIGGRRFAVLFGHLEGAAGQDVDRRQVSACCVASTRAQVNGSRRGQAHVSSKAAGQRRMGDEYEKLAPTRNHAHMKVASVVSYVC